MGQNRAPEAPSNESEAYDYDGIFLEVVPEVRTTRPAGSVELTRRIEQDKHLSASQTEQRVWVVLFEDSKVAEITPSGQGAWVVTPTQSIVPYRVTRSFNGALSAIAEGLRRLAHKQTGAQMLGRHTGR
ncbi:hypothetical protein [Azospirillum sp. SYSU D00513]|uniref:hypothetical protein n=1 Tax=Azospirillum sp. SYSU D00513 TaxID=2812561 RepID=UPI001A9624B7|nr:hypothetical protein [Azospirillum sp. SYSU D00513]